MSLSDVTHLTSLNQPQPHLPLVAHQVLLSVGLEANDLAPRRALLELVVGSTDRLLHRCEDLKQSTGPANQSVNPRLESVATGTANQASKRPIEID